MATGNPRNKCALKPGHSLLDWIRLGNSGVDLAGNRGQTRNIGLAELAQHNTPDDAWMAVHGKCYNVTRYMDFHPGGRDELMRGVGTDATRLFDEAHAWVNHEQMLIKCYLGPLIAPGNFATAGGGGASSSSSSTLRSNAAKKPTNLLSFAGGDFKMPLQTLAPASTHTSPTRNSLTVAAEAARRSASVDKSASLPASPTNDESPSRLSDVVAVLAPPAAGDGDAEIVPRFDWMQKSGELMLVFYTRALCNPGWSVELVAGGKGVVVVHVYTQRSMHRFEFRFLHAVRWPCSCKVSNDTGKIELIFRKRRAQLWTSFGLLDRRKVGAVATADDGNGSVNASAAASSPVDQHTFVYDVRQRTAIAPDSFALVLQPRANVIQYVPVGYHLRLATADGTERSDRSYTPVPSAFVPAECRQWRSDRAKDDNSKDDDDDDDEDDNKADGVDLFSAGGSLMALLVKRYSDVGAAMSTYLTQEKPLAGGLRLLQPRGSFSLYATRLHTRVAMLAAGSGLTPMLSVLEYMLERKSNRMETITLLYFNKAESDIWCRSYLDELAQKDKRLQIVHYLSASPTPPNWPASQTGRITPTIIQRLIDKSAATYSTYCFVCGPPAFNDECKRLLTPVGLDASKVHVFH